MKYIYLIILLFSYLIGYSQNDDWVETEGKITEITFHRGKKTRETATIAFKLEDGSEQIGITELFRVPFLGSMKSEGDTISIKYRKSNPVLVETKFGNLLSTYGMYILIFLGVLLSAKTLLSKKNTVNTGSGLNS
ncbi:hypothetical protein LV716_11685 [Flagellimonas sp. HMM57]|uniref:DUF3592 domain-containing protein n=1 Tax=unclassified Flagellimonas TaxID=2644544 RepID=UPI0013D1B09C|nr:MULTISPECIES: DUF3592 domain-containing protein [unclassified Flagellimonas]UII74917.1 hypothetical protein LV716_11685 [Flagellimonas sp. HMM57]